MRWKVGTVILKGPCTKVPRVSTCLISTMTTVRDFHFDVLLT